MSPKRSSSRRQYPREARLAELLREIAADTLERLADERLGLLTVQSVDVDAELTRARVFYAQSGNPTDDEEEFAKALEHARHLVQPAIGRQARVRSTPKVTLEADLVIESGSRIDEILRQINTSDPE
jgi:ribosome-binding factor A